VQGSSGHNAGASLSLWQRLSRNTTFKVFFTIRKGEREFIVTEYALHMNHPQPIIRGRGRALDFSLSGKDGVWSKKGEYFDLSKWKRGGGYVPFLEDRGEDS